MQETNVEMVSKEDVKNIFNNRLVISKKEYIDYLYLREEKGA